MIQICIVLKPYLHNGIGVWRGHDVVQAAVGGTIKLVESACGNGVTRSLASGFGTASSGSKHRRRIGNWQEVPVIGHRLPAVVAISGAV